MPRISDQLTIPEEELSFTCCRGSGPGGQHVNKVSSRVTLWFDLEGSPSLSAEQKERLRARLANRINRHGRLWLVARAERSQHQNREAAVQRFVLLLSQALAEEVPRRPTRVPKASRRQRLESKRHRSQIKRQGRGRVTGEE